MNGMLCFSRANISMFRAKLIAHTARNDGTECENGARKDAREKMIFAKWRKKNQINATNDRRQEETNKINTFSRNDKTAQSATEKVRRVHR